MKRRSFVAAGASLVASAAFANIFSGRSGRRAAGLSGQKADPFQLAPGFSCEIIDRTGETMNDGYRVAGRPDGMATFPLSNTQFVLMRNHELSASDQSLGFLAEGQATPAEFYDPAGNGGVSRIVFNYGDFSVASRNVVLGGTIRNCAGGTSPWGWLSCEETMDRNHGFVFVCDHRAASLQQPTKVPGYGRFVHEAATVDPATNICYLTEDRNSSCFYRFIPDHKDRPFVGQLQAMKVANSDNFDTARDMPLRRPIDLEWVTIPDPLGQRQEVPEQAQSRGAAKVRRGEGIWMGDGEVYFSSTSGGPVSGGQIFRVIFGRNGRRDQLELVAESRSRGDLDMPDNITLSPRGRLYLAEDGQNDQHIRCITASGEIRDLARNNVSSSEITGVCFDPSGTVMFANIQHSGLTIMIKGPFAEFEA